MVGGYGNHISKILIGASVGARAGPGTHSHVISSWPPGDGLNVHEVAARPRKGASQLPLAAFATMHLSLEGSMGVIDRREYVHKKRKMTAFGLLRKKAQMPRTDSI